MYKFDNKIVGISFLILIVVCYKFKFIIQKTDVSAIISFLSIYFGFLVTSFSIMINSTEIKKLYTKKDPEDNSLTLLHRLANYYKFSLGCSLFTIITLLIASTSGVLGIYSKILPSLILLSLYPINEIFKILFNLFTNKKVL